MSSSLEDREVKNLNSCFKAVIDHMACKGLISAEEAVKYALGHCVVPVKRSWLSHLTGTKDGIIVRVVEL